MINIKQIDQSFCKVTSEDREVLMNIYNWFSYYTESYRFNPLFKTGKWDGKIKLFDFISKKIPIGLVPQLKDFLNDNNIPYDEEYLEDDSFTIDEEYLDTIIKKLKIPFEPRDYQKKLVIEAINNKKIIGISATSSGKSLSIYLLAMIMLYNKRKVFIIVPSVSLVHQMYSDFQDYGLSEEKAQDLIHCIYSGQEKEFTKPVILTTWQSVHKDSVLKKYTKDLNQTDKQYDCIIVDETHKAKAGDGKKISNILESFNYSPWKIGVTGSLPKQELLKQQVVACLGEPVQIIKASELVDRGLATDLSVNCVFMKYNDEDSKYVRKIKDWNKESDFFNEHPHKMKFLSKLAKSKLQKHENSIFFFKRIKFGKSLLEEFKKFTEHVYYIDGSIDGTVREQIRKDIETKSGVILIASYGTFSTGINVKKLHNGIFAENPGKSDITLIQSLGRFLRQHEEKEISNIYDIVDDSRQGKFENYCYRHFKLRLETYRDEGWYINEINYQL